MFHPADGLVHADSADSSYRNAEICVCSVVEIFEFHLMLKGSREKKVISLYSRLCIDYVCIHATLCSGFEEPRFKAVGSDGAAPDPPSAPLNLPWTAAIAVENQIN